MALAWHTKLCMGSRWPSLCDSKCCDVTANLHATGLKQHHVPSSSLYRPGRRPEPTPPITTMSSFIATVKAAVTGEEQQEKNLLTQIDEGCTLTWKQRFIGFGCCFALGIALSIVSIPMLWTANITGFAIFYSVGSVVSLCSTMFLMGPIRQIKRMFEAQRAIATVVYLASIVATLVLAFTVKNAGLVLIMLVVQCIALAWYCLTWIPGGVTAVKAMLGMGG